MNAALRRAWARTGPWLVFPIILLVLVAVTRIAGRLSILLVFAIGFVVCLGLAWSISRSRSS